MIGLPRMPARPKRKAPLWLGLACCLVWIAGHAGATEPDAGSTVKPHTPPANAKIYKYLQGGTTSFSDIPPSQGGYVVYRTLCFACSVTSTVDWNSTRLHVDVYTDEIAEAARQFAVDPALVRAVIHAESGFNPRARSPKGAMGLMQLMPGTARMLGVTDPHLPGNNIAGGARYLSSLLDRFKNDVTLATAAYNAGPEAVKRHAGVPPYPETQVYVQRVKILYQRYRNHPVG